MADRIPKGTWVEIHAIVLQPGERAPQVPTDTQGVPLEMRAKGFLLKPAGLGQEAEIVTSVGRHLRGTVTAVNPAYTHSFGPPIPELLTVGGTVRDILRTRSRSQ